MIGAIFQGISLGLLLAISVGPIVFTVIKQSISNGRQGGLLFIAGIALSDIMLVAICNLFTRLFDTLNAHKEIMSIVASVFLIILGIYFVFFKKPALRDRLRVERLGKRASLRLLIAGFIMNIFNPGIIIFWLTTATTFADRPVNHRITIFTTALLIAIGADIAKVFLADQIGRKLTPENIHKVDQVNGGLLVIFGIAIILFQ